MCICDLIMTVFWTKDVSTGRLGIKENSFYWSLIHA